MLKIFQLLSKLDKSVLIRLLTIGLKALLSFTLIGMLDADSYVTYGLVAANIAFIYPILGMEFSNYCTREILREDSGVTKKLVNFSIFFLCCSTLILSIVSYLIVLEIIDVDIAIVLFLGLLVSEGLSQELLKLHTALKRPVTVVTIGFLRFGAWIPLMLVFFQLSDRSTRNAETVLMFWLAGSIVSVLYGIFILYKMKLLHFKFTYLDFEWIKKGFKSCLVYIVIASLLRMLGTFDRIILDRFIAAEELAAYLAFWSIAGAWGTLISSGYLIKVTPELIQYAQRSKRKESVDLVASANKHLLIMYIIGILILIPVAYIFLKLIDKEKYIENMLFLPLILVVIGISQSASLWHSLDFGLGDDFGILRAHVLAGIIFLTMTFTLVPWIGGFGAVIATLVSYLMIGKYKKYRYFKLTLQNS